MEEAREAGRVTIGQDCTLHLSAPEALPIDSKPKRTRDLIFSEIGTVPLADMITEMDAHTGFSEDSWHARRLGGTWADREVSPRRSDA